MKIRALHLFLIIVILLGVGIRFIQLDAHLLNGDEEFYIVGAEKFHAGSDYDVRIWNYHAPPVGKWLMSLPLVFTDVDYSIAYALPPNLWVWNYAAFESIGQIYPLVRGVSALFGILLILFIFLTGRELFGTTAGLWGAASAAVAIDLIILSRVAMVDIYLYAFIAASIFFYVKYRRSGAVPWLPALLVSLILMFGSKNVQWLVIIPPILYVEIMGNRKKVMKTVNFLIIMGIAWFVHSSIIYPPEISELATEFFTTGSNRNFIEPHFDIFFSSLFTMNSLFFIVVFLLTLGLYAGVLGLHKGRVDWGRIKRHLLYPNAHTFLLLIGLVSLVAFSLTSLSISSKYIGQLSIPFFVLGGLAAVCFWGKHKAFRGVLLMLLIVGAFSMVWYFPSYEGYPGQQVVAFSSPWKELKPYADALEKEGGPKIITNNMNLLIFYGGEALPIPVKDSPDCTEGLLTGLKGGGYLGVFKNIGDDEKQFLCSHVFEYSGEVARISEKRWIVSY